MRIASTRITALMLVTAAAGQAAAIDKSWFAAGGNWNVPGSWTPVGVPNPADNVFIGNLPIARNATVTVNNNTTIAGLSITDGMTLNTNLSRLTVNGPTTVSGNNQEGAIRYRSRLRVGQSAMPVDCILENLTAGDGANIDIEDGATMLVQGVFSLQDTATLSADGVLNLSSASPIALNVNGSIAISASASGLTINQTGAGRIDLDGNVADGRDINISARRADGSAFAKLVINGDRLTDSYSEILTVGARNSLTMNLSDGWTMAPSSELHLRGSTSFPGAADVYGSAMTVEGRIYVAGPDAAGRIFAPTVLEAGSQIDLNADTRLDFTGDTTVHGGNFNVGENARVRFEGDTTWSGAVTLAGTVQQNGDASVTGDTVINAERFDMDGSSLPAWTINAPFVVNADGIDTVGSSFHGSVSVSGASSRLEINLTDPAAHWIMNGDMTLNAPVFITGTRVAGSPMHLYGTLNASGRVRFDADVRWISGSTTNMGTTVTECKVAREGMIEQGATFAGGGYVAVDTSGHLTLGDNVNLGNTGIRNDGVVSVGPVAGTATARGFSQSASGELHVQIGGAAPAVDHDVLFVNGPSGAELDGLLRVQLLSPGGVQYVPTVGATYLIMSASSVSGAFDDVADTVAAGWTIEWTPIYGANSVWVQALRVYQTCGADFNRDGFVDFFDYDDFVNCFENGVCPPGTSADFNADGFADFFDYADYVAAFESGC